MFAMGFGFKFKSVTVIIFTYSLYKIVSVWDAILSLLSIK